MFRKLLKFILTEILYNGHLQALGASGIVYLSYMLFFYQRPEFTTILLVYLFFQFIYLNDRWRWIRKDEETNQTRASHISKYLKYVPILLVIYGVLVVYFSLAFNNFASFLFCLFVTFMGFLYPIYFKSLTKKIYLFKNIYVSSVFSILLIFPFIQKESGLNNNFIYFVMGYIFLETMIMQVVLDCKDMFSDKKERLLTLPVLVGKINSQKIIIIGIFLLYATIFLWLNNMITNMIFFRVVVFSLMTNVLTFVLLLKDNKFAYLLTASKYFLWLLLLLI